MSREIIPSRGYQKWASARIAAASRIPLIGRVGSGKTRIAIDGLQDCPTYKGQTVLIVCSASSIGTWKHELQQWMRDPPPKDKVIVARGSPYSRDLIWENRDSYRFIITTYGTVQRDWKKIINHGKRRWYCVISDEAHKWRNRKTLTYKCVKNISIFADRFYPMTGTSMRKGVQHFYTYLNLCYPRIFRSYWKFVKAFCVVNDTDHGQEILGPKNLSNLGRLLNKHAVFLPDEEVEKELPRGSRVPTYIDMTAIQAGIYEQIRKDMLAIIDTPEGGSSVIATPTVLAQITRLRQLLVCPKLLSPDIDDYGAGIEFIGERLEEDAHALILVPFTEAIPYIMEYLYDKVGIKDMFVLMGGIKAEEQEDRISRFEQTQGTMICSIAYAESFSLKTCSQSYILGSDWSWDANEQAEGRTRRRSSISEHVYWNYIIHNNTVESELVKENLNRNYDNVKQVMNSVAEFRRILEA